MIVAWLSRFEHSLARVPTTALAVVLAAIVVGVGIKWNTRVAGGADSYGYVSQADLWLAGRLTIPQPWVSQVPWPSAGRTFAPLGYRPRGVRESEAISTDHTTLVPSYSPGLPMLMALAKRLGGHCQMFSVVPLSAGVLVLATFGIGRRFGSPGAGLLAAWLVATSPTVLMMVVQPMSDVPVAAAWAVVLWCLLGHTVRSTFAAGAAAGLAVLIRPNLAPMAAIAVPWLAAMAWRARGDERRRGIYRTGAYVAAMAPAVVFIAMLNAFLYGSPMESGYGSLETLFERVNVGPNMRNYLGWLIDTQTPLALAGLASLFLPWVWGTARPDRAWILGLFATTTAFLWLQYFFYGQFDAWWYLRFLLASWPAILLGTAMVMTWPARAGRRGWATAALAAGLIIGIRGVALASDRFAFDMQAGEWKYAAVASVVRERTERNAVIYSTQHSGSLRHYGGRMTLHYVWLNPSWLDRSVSWLNERGAHPYAVLERWEVEQFRERFGERNAAGTLSMMPVMVYNDVFLFDLMAPPTSASAGVDVARTPVLPSCATPRPAPGLVLR